jgi:hypothetical protein
MVRDHHVRIRTLAESRRMRLGRVLHKGATAFAADRRADLDKAITQMKTQADAMKVKFDKLNKASG